MLFKTIADFFYMGGYAYYIWPAYFIAGVIFIINMIIPLRQRRKLLQSIRNKYESAT